jgi:hypothetical protein
MAKFIVEIEVDEKALREDVGYADDESVRSMVYTELNFAVSRGLRILEITNADEKES